MTNMTNPYKSNMFLHVLECFANSRDIGESEIWKFAAKDLKICSSSPSEASAQHLNDAQKRCLKYCLTNWWGSARFALFWYSDSVGGDKQEETLQQLCRCIRGFISQSIGDSALASVVVHCLQLCFPKPSLILMFGLGRKPILRQARISYPITSTT